MDKILIRALHVSCRIGCQPEERVLAQTLELDVTTSLRDTRAASSGRLEDTVCYKQTSEKIRELASKKEWALLEQFAEDVVALIFEEFSAAAAVQLEVRKFIIPGTRSVGIEVFRERNRV